ncbi:annexin A1-like [Conger conger]|uniref:annexin A1-like n=1 Tax=Conger conger TaxID=82655 RepID=UPI002A5AD268|nr:annexin A1-like [Conger conger]
MPLLDILRNIANELDGDDDDDFSGTVEPYSLFCARDDVTLMEKAIKTEGGGAIAIIDLLLKRNCEQRQMVKKAYQESSGTALDKDLVAVLSGEMKDLALALLMTPVQYDAFLLREAMEGWGTDEEILTEILVSRTNDEIREIKKVYKEEYQRDLETDLDKENRGHYQDALLNLCKGTRSEEQHADKDLADSDAQTLFNSGEDRAGTNDTVFIHIFTTRSNAELRKIFQRYSKHGDGEMAEVLEDELSGDVEDCLIAIAKCAMNKPSFFAEKLHSAMEGYGTRTKTLIRVLVTRAERDLKKVMKEYKKMYEKSLQQDILAESEGDFETALLTLCGKDD